MAKNSNFKLPVVGFERVSYLFVFDNVLREREFLFRAFWIRLDGGE